ncbi:MAG: preprotein translocase subunit SecE [Thermodesulfobacteriaceae bacterium]|nr:preprotein translocase subunit SecE [Thermodesulfobacteriaceae bacterium]MCX8041322.1 preprotein translocase subunit SecE [Thermodesulfobacteriaceae bacterium]MDW8136031.1 preprotein translocase subunit SecE [Thermodesulfobacterium sp.]
MKKAVLKKENEVERREIFFINRGVKFLKEVKIEAKKITWPQRKQVLMTSLMVILFSLFIGAYLGILDIIYNFIISFLVK